MRLKNTGKGLLAACLIGCLSIAMPLRAGTSVTELFISEYIEGSGFNKAIEIYNGTGFAKDLAQDSMTLEIYFNGNSSAGQTINLMGTLIDGDVFVIAHGQADSAILSEADQTTNSLSFNGDDAIVLKKNGVVIDVIGQVGFDPGSEWGTGNVSTQNNTIRRKIDVCGGDTDETNVFDPAPEWDGFPNNTLDGIGSHTVNCEPPNGIQVTCGGPINTTSGQMLVHMVSALDIDGTIVDIQIASVDPLPLAAPITIENVVPAAMVGGTATAEVHVPDTYPIGSYDLTIRAINNDAVAEIGECILQLGVAGVRTIAEIQGSPATQGPGGESPVAGAIIQTTGVVTALKIDGFFIQMAPGDGDPETSDGIFVYTQSAPTVALGDEVQVNGEVIEFFGLTEFSNGPTVQVLNSGLPLPPPIPLTSTFPDPNQAVRQLETVESMLVSMANGLVTTPGRLSFGINNFYAVADGTLRNLREPGLEEPDFPDLPLFDNNPEAIRIDFDQLTSAVRGVPSHPVAGQTFTAAGPLEYRFGDFRLLADDSFSITGSTAAIPVRDAQAGEFTIASFNMQFLETSNVTKIQKASLAIRNVLKAPDIVAMQEVVDQAALDALATQIGTDDPSLNYTAVVPADSDGFAQEVAYLLKDTVSNTTFSEFGIGLTYPNADEGCNAETLHNRPPYILDCTVTPPGGQAYDITIINLHLRSLSGIDDTGTNGERVRMKRFLAARTLAEHIEMLQTADPAKRILIVGDYNAYQFTDGLVDVLGIIAGDPSIDLIESSTYPEILTRPLRRLGTLLKATEQYSFVFGKNAQQLDHMLATDNFGCDISGYTVGRLNADFPATIFGNDAMVPERTSDHDPPLLYIQTASNPLPGIVISDASSIEGTGSNTQTVTFTVNLCSTSMQTVSVDWTLVPATAQPGSDFIDAMGTVTFDPGSTEETVQIDIVADADKEALEFFLINLDNPQNAVIVDPEGRGNIINDDAVDPLGLDIISSILRTPGESGLRAWPNGGTGEGTYGFQWVDVSPMPTLMFDPNVNPVVIEMGHPLPAAFRVMVTDALGNSTGGTTILGDTVPILAPIWGTDAPNFEFDNDSVFTVKDWISILNFSQQKDNAYPCDN